MVYKWNLRIKDTLGAELLSSFRRLSSGGRFIQITIFIAIIIKELSCILVQEAKELADSEINVYM